MSNVKEPIAISERELLAMTRDMDAMHHDFMPQLHAFVDELSEQTRATFQRVRDLAELQASRRNFLAGGLVTAGALGGGMVLSACGSGGSSNSASPTPNVTDVPVAQLAASLEILAVNTYAAALKAATSGALGTVPAAVGTFALTAQTQHNDHKDAWNAILSAAGKPKQTAADPKLQGTVQTQLAAVKSITDLAKLALTLETVAMETYTAGAALLTDSKNRAVALTIAPVEAQHVAILNFVIGQYPSPDSYVKTDQARGVSDLS